MRRREFIALVGAIGLIWPRVTRAQQPAPIIGVLGGTFPGPTAPMLAAFREGLAESGYVEAQNVAIEYRWAEGQYDRLPTLAADLVKRSVAVIVTLGVVAAQAAQKATKTIPIVFTSGPDPVAVGLVSSLNRPGANVTGVSLAASELTTKRLDLLRDLVPGAIRIAFLVNPSNPNAEQDIKEAQTAANAMKQQIQVLRASTIAHFERAFALVIQQRSDALMVGVDAFFLSQRDSLVALAARHRVPTVYEWREFVAAGGLMSYGTNLSDMYRNVGVYTGRILKGAKPVDLPVLQPTKFELVINLKTAKSLGLTVSPSLLARADEVIE